MAKTQRGRDHIDVLVVGAGPTGLTIAGELARRGVTTRIIERRADKSSLSKALVLQARTLEMMDLADLVDEFLERGYPAPGLDIGLSTDEPVAVNLQHLDTRFPFLLVLPQVDTEQILERRLSQHGMTVERGVSFERLERNDAEGVAAIARHDDGGEEQIRSNYLVGCDGTHSLVRDALGLPFEGEDLADIVFLADVKLDAEFVRSRIANFTSERGFLSILPFLGTYSRVFAVDFTKQDRPPTDALTLEDLQEAVDAIAPRRIALREPTWITRFRSPSRSVPRLRTGSALVAGDAAHSHSPAGGQG